MSNNNNFPLFFIQGSLIKTYATMYSCFSTSTFVKRLLLINFYYSGRLLHYPILLLPLDKFNVNNKQTYVICILSNTKLFEMMIYNYPATFMNCTATYLILYTTSKPLEIEDKVNVTLIIK